MRDSIFKPRFQVGMHHTRWKRPYIFGRIPHFDSTNYLMLISRSFSTIFKYQTFSVVWVERNLYFGRPAPWLLVFHQFKMKLNIAPVYKPHWSVTIYIEIYVELYCSNTRGDCNMICWLQFDLYIKSLIVILLNHYTVITALAFMIIVNKKNAVP